MKKEFIVGLAIITLFLLGGIIIWLAPTNTNISSNSQPFIEIVDPAGFVNTNNQPIKIGDYIGKKVILLDVMTYSCINCQRTFPYVTAWYEKYKDEGLIVIGIHTPEFAFEKNKENVEEAMKKFGINFPVVLDNNYGTWNAYGNHYWPRKYLIDINGNIVYDHIGEGDYEETEMKIRELLTERAEKLGENMADISPANLAVSEVSEIKKEVGSPETYFGANRNELLANGQKGVIGLQSFKLPQKYSLNKLYLSGNWNIQDEYAESVSNSNIIFRYNSKEVYFVAEADIPIQIEVWQDNQIIKTEIIKESGLYTLIKNNKKDEHLLELKIKGSGLKAYTFTFG